MTYEEMERTMQFILEQQAQFSANQQAAEERVTRLERNVSGLAMNVSGLTGVVSDLATNMSQMSRAQTQTYEVVAALAEAQRHTEEKLDAFIGVLERYISEGRNGGDKPAAGGEV